MKFKTYFYGMKQQDTITVPEKQHDTRTYKHGEMESEMAHEKRKLMVERAKKKKKAEDICRIAMAKFAFSFFASIEETAHHCSIVTTQSYYHSHLHYIVLLSRRVTH